MYTCDICLKVFNRRDNMLRHKKGAHIQHEEENELSTSDVFESDTDSSNEEKEETDRDDLSTSDVSESDTDSSNEEQEETATDKRSRGATYDPWDSVVQKAFEKCGDQFEEEVTKLLHKDSISEKEARSVVYEDMRSKYRKAMITVFTYRMVWFDAIRKHPVYKAIKKTATNLVDIDEYSQDEAWKSAIGQRKYLFDTILDEYSPPEIESEEDQSESEDELDQNSESEAIEPAEKKYKQ